MDDVIGAVRLRGTRYELLRSGEWRGRAADVVEILNGAYSPAVRTRTSSAVLPSGYEAVEAAARWVGDPDPELPAFPPAEPDRVY
jgi:hypothetical protein